jgi:hypothetical protein
MADQRPAADKSPWPVITVIFAAAALGLAGWNFALQTQNKGLKDDLKKLRGRVEAVESHAEAIDKRVAAAAPPVASTPSSRRRRAAAAAAAATNPTTAPTTAPAAKP